MPDKTCRAEANPIAGLLEPPADIHVITGGFELSAEAADTIKRVFADRQIAAGQMLGLGIV